MKLELKFQSFTTRCKMRDSEYKKRVIEYVKKNLKKGYTLESLKWALVDQGYSRTLVDLAIKDANLELSREAPVLHEKPMITHEIIGENDLPVQENKSWWRRLFGL